MKGTLVAAMLVVLSASAFGGEGQALLGASKSDAGGVHQLSTGGGFGLLRVGFLALASESLDVYPMLAIGGGAMNLKIIERSAQAFDDVLNDPCPVADTISSTP